MPRVFIPTLLREFTAGRAEFAVEGSTVRQVIESLNRECPGVRERLIEGGRLRANISVAIDGEVTPLALLESVAPESEIHFVVAISGGIDSRPVAYAPGSVRGVAYAPGSVRGVADTSGSARDFCTEPRAF